MRRIVTLGTALGLVALAAAFWPQPCDPQNYPTDQPARPLEGFIMGGFSPTAGDAASYLQDGWIIDAGFIYWLAQGDTFGLRTDIGYSEHEATNQFRALGGLATNQRSNYGWGSFSSFSSGLKMRAPSSFWPRVYGVAQIGVTNTHVRLAQAFYIPYENCDPFFYYCSNPIGGYASGYSYTTNRFSWNVGLGLDFQTPGIPDWFVELQYRRVQTTPHAFEYWPVMIGFRF